MTRLRLFLLLAFVAGLLWLTLRDEDTHQDTGALPPELLGQPDLYLLDADIAQFDALGNLHYELRSRHIRHFENDGMTRLQEPTLTLHTDPRAPWQATARRGFIRRGPAPGETGAMEEVVFLRESVELEQRLPSGSFMRLRTPSLYVYPDREFAQTSDSVMIDTEVGRTVGRGMRFDMSKAILNVFSNGDVTGPNVNGTEVTSAIANTTQHDANERVKTIILPDQFK